MEPSNIEVFISYFIRMEIFVLLSITTICETTAFDCLDVTLTQKQRKIKIDNLGREGIVSPKVLKLAAFEMFYFDNTFRLDSYSSTSVMNSLKVRKLFELSNYGETIELHWRQFVSFNVSNFQTFHPLPSHWLLGSSRPRRTTVCHRVNHLENIITTLRISSNLEI